jgi:hypothetical protein
VIARASPPVAGQGDLFDGPPVAVGGRRRETRPETRPGDGRGWHTIVYRIPIGWIALGRRTPFRAREFLLGPAGGRVGLGHTRSEAMEALREAIAA